MIDERDMIDLADWTIHGGRLSDAAIAFPDAPSPWLDLSTGINPDPWPGTAGLAIDWQRLPNAAAIAALEAAAAWHFGAGEPDVLALPGTESGLRGLRGLPLPAPFRHVAPGYGTHGEALPGSRPIPADRLVEEAALGGTILCANPANPDGRLIAVDHLLEIAAILARSGGWLVIDEAFIDAHPDASILPRLSGDEPIIVLRSFGKFFGLAGVRLGFAVAPPAIIAPWRAAIGSWPVSAAAIAIGAAAYADADWRVRRRARCGAAPPWAGAPGRIAAVPAGRLRRRPPVRAAGAARHIDPPLRLCAALAAAGRAGPCRGSGSVRSRAGRWLNP